MSSRDRSSPIRGRPSPSAPPRPPLPAPAAAPPDAALPVDPRAVAAEAQDPEAVQPPGSVAQSPAAALARSQERTPSGSRNTASTR